MVCNLGSVQDSVQCSSETSGLRRDKGHNRIL